VLGNVVGRLLNQVFIVAENVAPAIPVPPPDAPRVPQAGAAPLPAVMSACPDVPNPIVPELASVVPRFVENPHAPEALMTCALAAVAPQGK